MTVIRRKQQNYNYPNSSNGSDTESLHLPSAPASDAESLNNEPITRRPYGNCSTKRNFKEDLSSLKKNAGRRKHRRYHNRCSLETLSEEDEDDTVNLMSSCKSPFGRLLEDDKALQYWNDFIEKSEEDQEAIIKSYSAKIASDEIEHKQQPFYRISSKIRRTIKIKKNLTVQFVQNYEEQLVEFFKKTPKDTFKKSTFNSFERLLLHAIAQYHGLSSKSTLEGDSRYVEVHNINDNWTPAERYLFNFIAEKRGY